MARVTINDNTKNVTFLVLKGLSEEGILGNYFLESHEARIDCSTQRMCLKFKGMRKVVEFKQNEYGRENTIRTVKTQILTAESPIETIERPRRIDDEAQHRLDKLIEDYREIFREEPGLVRGYEC